MKFLIKSFCGGYDRNFAYLVYDEKERKAIAIDPVLPDKILEFIKKEDLDLVFIMNTHSHFDHISGNQELISKTNAELLALKENEVIELASLTVSVIATPGHTNSDVSILINNSALFTGDTLFVGKIGGNFESTPKIQFESLKKLMKLNDNIIIYPGHDYGETPTSTIKKEKATNPFIQRLDNYDDFIWIKENWMRYRQEHKTK
ncbi:MAG: hydroxyacylglutathione hydrolase family protein [Candidatus Woesearchaeota archaeon]